MAIYKNKDIETNIKATHVSLGNIGAQFYTEDENSASIRIYIKHNDKPVNLETAGLTPILSLSMQDGSYFDNEPVDIVLAEQGLIQYKIRENVIKHVGKVKATLRLKSETQSLHASEFSFTILSSGLDEQVAKEINIDLIGDKVEEVLLANADKFKGQDANPEEVKVLLEPYAKDAAKQEFEKLSTAKQVDSEVINARHLSNNLSDEISRIENKVYTKSTNKMRPMVTFYLDDGYQNDYDIVYPKAKELDMPLTICLLNTSHLLSTPERLDELKNNGWEVHAHTATHPDLDTLTLDQQRKEMLDNILHLKSLGHDPKGLCFPRGLSNADTLKASREYFEVAMSSIAGINRSPIDTYYVKRTLVNTTDVNKMKSDVDKIKADGHGWIVFYSHSNAFNTDIEAKNRYFEMMEYVKSSGVDVVTVGDAMKVYGNTLDIGDEVYSDNFFKLGGDGNINTSNMPVVYNKNISQINSKPFSEFATKKITVTSYELDKKSDIPIDNGVGTLYTDRRFEVTIESGSGAFQRFEGFQGTVATRRTVSGQWTDWISIGSMNTFYKAYKNTTPITDFPKYKITKTTHLSAENTGFPEPIGTLETVRLSDNDILNYQLFYPYNKTYFYKRNWTSSGWGTWGKTSNNLTLSQSFDFGEITANSSKAFKFTIDTVTNADVPSINFVAGLNSSLIPIIYTSGANTVEVKLTNISNSNVTVGTRPIVISVIKN